MAQVVNDQLSEVFDLVKIRGLVSGGFASRGPWVARAPIEDPLKLIAMVSGRSRLTTDGVDEPIELEPGDVAILNNRSWIEQEGGTGGGARTEILPQEDFARLADADRGTDDVVIGIAVDLNAAGRSLLSQALPALGHVRASAATATNLRGNLDRLFDEVTGDRIGSAFAVGQYGQLLLLDVLRAYVDQCELPPGWLRLLTDERLRPALSLMHTEPAGRWGLRELANAAGMSRTSFAVRFRTLAGQPPLTYLNRWRMLLAQRALRDGDVQIGSLAVELGYASESAFSTAFKRELGESPLRYRQRHRQ
ncbi:AraC family transcriptional regulator [Streptantibioticus cattleyicolor]|uniref:Helix-turn-helix domain-containing protein n=1 Tax=Streptantibioticus cattleyicolor (strain ATCC 35852 / DSM 46488 / JCM 4925 / NBRC 14057 / NRRL 8057) TaxID=1003195 RepID=F8JJJ2_STREN|nr:AraC family transcriptional regulator [Streptantibioticus cattleyicolor]AEW98675.1 helix-turn-helix domain-containing protein [Streptantibioticus cattleyicolor NRRL 8057 = DSM 46488]CCB72267.1 Transcriptional regulator, AraC family [Streptantibioticus cattleyicolor NRRL 8057 = DSM 46488]